MGTRRPWLCRIIFLACMALLTVGLYASLWAKNQAAYTSQEARELLLETFPMPENAALVETEDFLGWKTPYIPVGGDTTPDAQQSSTQLCYHRLTPNKKYYEFWLYSALLDIPSAGEEHCSTLNFYAVNIYTGEILVERTDTGIESWDVYLDAITQ